jgi:Ca-activated chloride channel family protein
MKYRILALIVLLVGFTSAQAQYGKKPKEPKTRILFIFDASNSMNGKWQSSNKNSVAQKLLSQALDSLRGVENLELALRVYGHQKYYRMGQDCDDTKLEVPFGGNNAEKIINKLKKITPKGTTPIAQTLEKAGEDFSFCADCRNIIIMITDGIEECGGDPCAVSMMLQDRGIVLKPFVIGIGLDLEFRESFECVGNFFDASDENTFKKVLGVVISQALNSTTAQINLVDANGNPSETDVPITLYDRNTNRIVENFMHTMNAKGYPDTLILDPVIEYRMTVHTVPEVQLDSFQLIPGKHNIIGVDAPQGSLEIKSGTYRDRVNFQTIVRKDGEMNTIYVQDINQVQRYLVGYYDLEILSLPRIYLNKVAISQSHTTTVEIPKPGQATLIRGGFGPCSILVERDNKLEKVIELNPKATKQTISLQPGKYRAIYRPSGAKGVVFSQEEEFIIKSGASTSINF